MPGNIYSAYTPRGAYLTPSFRQASYKESQVANWIVTVPDNDKWAVRLADCSREHAKSVLADLSGGLPVLDVSPSSALEVYASGGLRLEED